MPGTPCTASGPSARTREEPAKAERHSPPAPERLPLHATGKIVLELISSAQDLAERGHRLEIRTGHLAGTCEPQGAGKVLLVVFAAMAEVEREFINERTLVGLGSAAANGKHGGRPPAVDGDMLSVALRRRDAKESVIAAHLGSGRSTLYRTLAAYDEATATTSPLRSTDIYPAPDMYPLSSCG
ncbi:recombinase family protein [Streptomyces sp. LARHCF249]